MTAFFYGNANHPNVTKIIGRRFGRDHDKPCANPNMLTCARWECQKRDRCKDLPLVEAVKE